VEGPGGHTEQLGCLRAASAYRVRGNQQTTLPLAHRRGPLKDRAGVSHLAQVVLTPRDRRQLIDERGRRTRPLLRIRAFILAETVELGTHKLLLQREEPAPR